MKIDLNALERFAADPVRRAFLEEALEISWSHTMDYYDAREAAEDFVAQNMLRRAIGLSELTSEDLDHVKSRRAGPPSVLGVNEHGDVTVL